MIFFASKAKLILAVGQTVNIVLQGYGYGAEWTVKMCKEMKRSCQKQTLNVVLCRTKQNIVVLGSECGLVQSLHS